MPFCSVPTARGSGQSENEISQYAQSKSEWENDAPPSGETVTGKSGFPVLLFADCNADDYSAAVTYQWAKAVATQRQHVTMGFKKGHTVLLHYQGNETKYQGVLFLGGFAAREKRR